MTDERSPLRGRRGRDRRIAEAVERLTRGPDAAGGTGAGSPDERDAFADPDPSTMSLEELLDPVGHAADKAPRPRAPRATRHAAPKSGDATAGRHKVPDLSALVAYFERATKSIQTPRNEDADERRGCLITNTVIELGRSDKDVAEIIDRYFARVERAFCDLIKRSQKNGSIRADLDPKATARWLFITAQGMSVSARFGRSFSGLPEIVRAALAPPSA